MMRYFKGIKKISALVLVIIAVLSAVISYVALNSRLAKYVDGKIPPYVLTIEVLDEVNPDAIPSREVWITHLELGGEQDMAGLFAQSESQGFEFRTAVEYGYSNDVITNAGGVGSTIRFTWIEGENTSCEFWKQNFSGMIRFTLTRGAAEVDSGVIDLYSAQAEDYYEYSPDLPAASAPAQYIALQYGVLICVAALIFLMLSLLLSRLIIIGDKKMAEKKDD